MLCFADEKSFKSRLCHNSIIVACTKYLYSSAKYKRAIYRSSFFLKVQDPDLRKSYNNFFFKSLFSFSHFDILNHLLYELVLFN